MRTAIRELQYAIRRLRGTPGFTIAATLTLAIAIGATASVFSVVDGVLLKPFPYRDGDRVLMIFERSLGEPHFAVSPANYLDWRAQTRAFTTLAAASIVGGHFTVTGGPEAQRVSGFPVTPSYFPVLGITPVLGRSLAEDSLLVFGALPAWQTSRGTLADFLGEGGRGTGAAQHHRLQDGLVILQLTVAFVLLTGAGLLVESFTQFERIDLGFRPAGVLTGSITLSPQRYPTAGRGIAFVKRVEEQLAAQPGVTAASVGIGFPGHGLAFYMFTVVGDPAPDPSRAPLARTYLVSPDYFRTMGIALRRGRSILPSGYSSAVPVVVIDDLLARRFFAGRDPIGQRLAIGKHTVTIVGVAASVREEGATGLGPVAVYVPVAQMPGPLTFLTLAVRVGMIREHTPPRCNARSPRWIPPCRYRTSRRWWRGRMSRSARHASRRSLPRSLRWPRSCSALSGSTASSPTSCVSADERSGSESR